MESNTPLVTVPVMTVVPPLAFVIVLIVTTAVGVTLPDMLGGLIVGIDDMDMVGGVTDPAGAPEVGETWLAAEPVDGTITRVLGIDQVRQVRSPRQTVLYRSHAWEDSGRLDARGINHPLMVRKPLLISTIRIALPAARIADRGAEDRKDAGAIDRAGR
jgi:hypothetical protein